MAVDPPPTTTTVNPDEALDLALAAQQGDANEPLGGYFNAPSFEPVIDSTSNMARNERLDRGLANPVAYTQEDIGPQWTSLPTEVRVRLQQEMIAIGLLKPDPTRTKFFLGDGSLDAPTTDALKQVFSLANANGERWDRAYSRYVASYQNGMSEFGSDSGGGGGGRAAPVLPKYAPPDTATLRQNAKKGISQALGREVQDDEMPDLLAKLSEDYRAQYDAQITQAQGGTAADVDPQARFAEMIESKYANELSLLDQRDDNAAGVAMAQQQTSFIDRVLGGV